MHRKIWIGLSAALLALKLSAPAEAALTTTQLDAVEEYVATGNWARLREFLLRNPGLWDGEDVLAQEFRRFLENTSSLYTALTFQDTMFPGLAGVEAVPEPTRAAQVPTTRQQSPSIY